jgi:hypothetical protein
MSPKLDLTLDLRSGEMVEVRSATEILATLDKQGALDALPFMPEMLQFCGLRFRVHHRADKTCDTISAPTARRLHRTVHLEGLRCNGDAHGGCQAGCLLFWKEAWLKRAPADADTGPAGRGPSAAVAGVGAGGLAPADRERLDHAARNTDDAGERFSCQATDLLRASSPLKWWDVRQYLRDLLTGNVSLARFVRGMAFASYGIWRRRVRRDYCYPIVGGTQTTTPTERLDLKPGELVKVRSREEILATLDHNARNRGLYYDAEMWRFSGGTYRVLRRVERIIDEKTGRMIRLPGDCIVLEGATCSGERSTRRLFCPRSIFPYWREIWLRRVS